MENHKVWYLKQIDLFQGMPDHEVQAIAEKMVEKSCIKKHVLYTPFDTNDTIYVIKKGEVTLYNLHKGKKLIIDVLEPGSLFGNITFQEQKSTHFAEVTKDALICVFKVEEFMKILQKKPFLMIRLLRIMSDRLTNYEQKLKSGLFDAKEKILYQLKLLEESKGGSILSRMFASQKTLTHEKLGELTGLSRETVTRAIKSLTNDNKIKKTEAGRIVLCD